MSNTVYELQKRAMSSGRWRHIGYFRNEREAHQEQWLPIGSRSGNAEWKILTHDAVFDPDQPDRAILVNTVIDSVPLGRTAFFI